MAFCLRLDTTPTVSAEVGLPFVTYRKAPRSRLGQVAWGKRGTIIHLNVKDGEDLLYQISASSDDGGLAFPLAEGMLGIPKLCPLSELAEVIAGDV